MTTEQSRFQELINGQLTPHFPEERDRYWLARALLEDSPHPVDSTDYPGWLEHAVKLLISGVPIQYVTGISHFFGRTFHVSPDTLIPRPETEELVDHALNWLKPKQIPATILDVGTGSGIIAVTLATSLPQSNVIAWDISKEALEVASENADRHQVNLKLQCCNALESESWDSLPTLDLIMSNPPYIAESERSSMGADVLAHEPHQALFAAGTDPLVFYRMIALQGRRVLQPGGKVFVECSTFTALETKKIFEENGYKDVHIHQDLQGLDRIVEATHPD